MTDLPVTMRGVGEKLGHVHWIIGYMKLYNSCSIKNPIIKWMSPNGLVDFSENV